MKQELQRVAEQMAELFDTSSGIAQSVSNKADTQAVSSIMGQLTEYSTRSAEELKKLEGSSDAKIREAQEEMKRQLAHEIEQALLNLPAQGAGTNALLRGFCLSCNQEMPRAKPRFPRLLVNPTVRDHGDHGDLGVRMYHDDAGSFAANSLDPSIDSLANSQLSHAEKVDVMGGGFRLLPPTHIEQKEFSKPHTKPLMRKNHGNGGGGHNLVMKQKIQREGIGRLQPMLPVPSSNPSVQHTHIHIHAHTYQNIETDRYRNSVFFLLDPTYY